MNIEDKDLLLKDLCARLPYGMIVDTPKGKGRVCDINLTIFGTEVGVNINPTIRDTFDIEDIRPYLFPLSSMTEEQKEFLIKNYKFTFDSCGDNITNGVYSSAFNRIIYHTINEEDLSNIIDWLNANHFDYRGLIEKSLALDATGLNIY